MMIGRFDAFLPPHKEFRVRTAVGGLLTICAILLSSVLFASELQFFLELDSKDTMTLDTHQDRKLFTYNISLTFPNMPCSSVGINMVDVKGLNIVQMKSFITKQRSVGHLRVRDSLKNIAQVPEEMLHVLKQDTAEQNQETPTVRARCPSCFLNTDLDQCCWTCEDVTAVLLKYNRTMPSDYVFEQCAADTSPTMPEGCYVEASFTLHKKSAKMLIGTPKHLPGALHPDFREQVAEGRLNWTHQIHNVTFGPHFPGFVPVLDGALRMARIGSDASATSQYFHYDVHIIPTVYVPAEGEKIESHQYSVTDFMKYVDPYTEGTSTLEMFGGIEINLSFTPFQVAWIKSKKKWMHFVTECCAIVGGIIAFSTMIDRLWYRFAQLTRGAQIISSN